MSSDLHPIFDKLLSRKHKEQALKQRSKVFWFTGLSGSGKSTIVEILEKELFALGYVVQVLDGDNTRTGICSKLGFGLEDRTENIRRVAEVSKLFCQSGIICLNSFISPTEEIRALAKSIIGEDDYVEIYVNASLNICESRDVKGLYAKARAGEIKGFTGIDSPYEAPVNPFLEIDTSALSISESVQIVFDHISNLINTP